jgi:hypothetical protein
MANQLSKLLTFIIEVYDAIPLVNTICFKDDDVVDVEKENVYPLVSIQLLSGPAPDWYNRQYIIAFEVLNQRDDTKTSTGSKLLADTNYIDNVGITDSIANNFIMEVLKDHNDLDIQIVDGSISTFEPVRKDERNALDGVKFSATFMMHQNGI